MREAGFYWVRDGKEWLVAEYIVCMTASLNYWVAPWYDYSLKDKDWAEIDERRIVREEERDDDKV